MGTLSAAIPTTIALPATITHHWRVVSPTRSPRCHRQAKPDDVLPCSGDGAEAELFLGSFHAQLGVG